MRGRTERESREEFRATKPLLRVVIIGAEPNDPLSTDRAEGPVRYYLIGPSQLPWKGGRSIIPSLQIWKLRPREVKKKTCPRLHSREAPGQGCHLCP